MVGISLLTLVPGISGGSETYARELCRALARVGELRYQVFVPEIARDGGDGLPTTVVTRYRSGITPQMRLRFSNRILSIRSISNTGERNRELVIRCVEKVGEVAT